MHTCLTICVDFARPNQAGQSNANELRHRQGRIGYTWFLDELFVMINGVRHRI